MDTSETDIKTMKLYSDVNRVYSELKELGYGEKAELKVEDVNKFDQYHYHGTDAVDHCIKQLGINSTHRVLDIGSGIGGPGRYLVSKTDCSVMAIELQEDLHKVALDLTKRCGMAQKMTHCCGNILYQDLGGATYDFIVSWLVFLHIDDRKKLYDRCSHHLKKGGKMWIEDFFVKGEFTEQEKADLKEAVYVNRLPSREEYIKQLQDAGYLDVQFVEMTDSWTAFVKERLEKHKAQKDRHVRVIGEHAYSALEYFYTKICTLFGGGHLGGCCVIATRPNDTD